MELICKWCQETKQDYEFLRRNTDLPYSQANVRCCKACNSKRNRDRYKDPSIRTKQLRANDKWRREHPEKMLEYTKAFYERNPLQQQARARVKHMLRMGYWTRQPCCLCGSTENVEAHHDSYAPAHWESVRWLCKAHHERWHTVLDPVKNEVLEEELVSIEKLRSEAGEILQQMKELRVRFRKVSEQANEAELAVWTKVQMKASSMFEDFAKCA